MTIIIFCLNWFDLATKIWESHDLVTSTIGAMNMEKVSFDNMTILYYLVIVLFPILSIMEIGLYLLYQYKVNYFNINRLHLIMIMLSSTPG